MGLMNVLNVYIVYYAPNSWMQDFWIHEAIYDL